jgi:predicted metal-dependent peptidase
MSAAQRAISAALSALRTIPAFLPELAELCPAVTVATDERVPTAGIFPSGRMVLSPTWFASLSAADALFVVAHELMHLLLRTHDRRGGEDARIVNIAHDYIINDMLSDALGRDVPASGLEMPGARNMSLEELAHQIRRMRDDEPFSSFLGANEALDVLDEDLEKEWFPEELREIDLAGEKVRQLALRAASVGELRRVLEAASTAGDAGSGGGHATFDALRSAYRPPWQEALQTWMEATAPGARSYARASRRGADRTDVVLAGRRREGWTLHIVLDTSGSMLHELPRILGTIASFCEGANVSMVHILQCDVAVTKDEIVDVEQLRSFELGGFGGSDMSPAMLRLADDPEVGAAIVITDGAIDYPVEPMPYAVLWAVTTPWFRPPYGTIVCME